METKFFHNKNSTTQNGYFEMDRNLDSLFLKNLVV